MKNFALVAIATLSMGSISACQTISEESCLAGSWEDVGFKDGEMGHSRSKLSDIIEACQKYGAAVDRSAYMRGLRLGHDRYCRGDTGFDHGKSGFQPNYECKAGNYDEYMDRYEDGYFVYEARQSRSRLIKEWEEVDAAQFELETRLETEDLLFEERRILRRRIADLDDELDRIHTEIGMLEANNGFERWTPPKDRYGSN